MRFIALSFLAVSLHAQMLVPIVAGTPATASCTTPTGTTWYESYGDTGTGACFTGYTGCAHSWTLIQGSPTIAASPSGAPANTACANGLQLAPAATIAAVYATITGITTVDLHFTVYWSGTPSGGTCFFSLKAGSTMEESLCFYFGTRLQIQTAAGGVNSSGTDTNANVAPNTWYDVLIHIDSVLANSYFSLNSGTHIGFTAVSATLTRFEWDGPGTGAETLSIGNMYY